MTSTTKEQLRKERLRSLGYTSFFDKQFKQLQDESLTPARIAIEHKNRYVIYTGDGEYSAELSGKFRHTSSITPAVGDWVVVCIEGDLAIIHHLFARRTKFSRVEAGTISEEQIVAANIDTVFIVVGLDANYNLRRTERYLVVAQESGADPVIVLNKCDLHEDMDDILQAVAQIAGNAAVIPVSATTGHNIERLRAYASDGQTIALLGSSGVGKSSLVNAIIGDAVQVVSEVSDHNTKGRHTTTHRELIKLPTGGLIMDTPGMRELQVVSSEDSLAESFADVEALATECHFRDCTHADEPDCAVQLAIANGDLDQFRWRSYQKLQREIRHFEVKNDIHAMLAEKARWKKIHREVRRKYEE